MPLFNRHNTPPAVEQHTTEDPKRHSSLFSRRSTPPSSEVSSKNDVSRTSTTHSRGLLHRHNEDPSVMAARERVVNAEAAEREADKALAQARAAVRDAREHIKVVEREAREEARLAKIKAEAAKGLNKRGGNLGRHNV